MSFDTTARQRLATGAEEQEMPACLPLVSSMGDERATMLFKEELETEVFANNGGGISIKQASVDCEDCGAPQEVIVSFFGTHRIIEIANALLAFAAKEGQDK